MPIPRQDLQLSHGLWGFEDDPGGGQLPPVHQTKKTQLAKQEWKRLIDIQRHLVLTQSRESHSSSSSSDKEVLRDIGHNSRGASNDTKSEADKQAADDKAKGKRRRVQVKTSTGSRLPPNKNRKSSTADAVEEAKLQRKTSVSLPVVSQGESTWSPACGQSSQTRDSSTAPELGSGTAQSDGALHSGRTAKAETSRSRVGIRGEQSVMLRYLDTPPAPTSLRIADSGFSSSGSGKQRKWVLIGDEMEELLISR